jgi:TonB family protein
MKNILILFVSTLLISMISNGQNLFFIDEISYPSTNIITLTSNTEGGKDLDIIFAKDGNKGVVGLSTKTTFAYETFRDKLIIYLYDGSVISCADFVASENVDWRAKAAYYLTSDDLNKLKKSDIHTVRYSLNGLSEIKHSASNQGITTGTIITDFFDYNIVDTIEYEYKNEVKNSINEINSRSQNAFANNGNGSGGQGSGTGKSQGVTFPGGNQGVPTGDPNSNNYGQGGSGNGSKGSGVSISLFGRTASSLPIPKYPGDDEGIVDVKITVDKNGNVTAAELGVRGTTIMNQEFWEEAKQAALKAKFNADNNAPAYQQGTITYKFVID